MRGCTASLVVIDDLGLEPLDVGEGKPPHIRPVEVAPFERYLAVALVDLKGHVTRGEKRSGENGDCIQHDHEIGGAPLPPRGRVGAGGEAKAEVKCQHGQK